MVTEIQGTDVDAKTHELEPYVEYHGHGILKNAIDSHATGLKVQFNLKNEDDLNDFKKITKRRRGKAGVTYRIHYRPVSPVESEDFNVGDVFLLGANWSHSIGATVAFEIAEREIWEEFRGWTAMAAKDSQPQEIEFLLFRVTDQGELMNVAQRNRVEKVNRKANRPKGGPQSKRAARICQDFEFHRYLESIFTKAQMKGADNNVMPKDAADWLRDQCKIESRAELDHDEQALKRFETLMSRFNRWRGS